MLRQEGAQSTRFNDVGLLTMRRYYFNVRDDEKLTPDDEGLQFGDVAAAREETARAIAEMLKDVMPDGAERVITIEVRDEDNRPLFRTTVRYQVEQLS